MTQQNLGDLSVDNGTGAAVRTELNKILSDIGTCHMYAAAPTTTTAGMWWFDSTANVLKLRNEGNSAWITMPFSVTASNEIHGALVVNGELHVDHADGIQFSDTSVQNVAAAGIAFQQATKTDTQLISSTGWQDVTGLSVAITPVSTSSTVLVTVNMWAYTYSGQGYFKVVRNGSDIGYIGDAASSRTRAAGCIASGSTYETWCCQMTYLDSPASTSAQTYKVQVNKNGYAHVEVNAGHTDDDSATSGRYASSITVMEIAPSEV